MTIKWVKSDPLVMNGEPFCYGTRLTVRNLLEMRRGGLSPAAMLSQHPELRRIGIAEAYLFASQNPERYAAFIGADGAIQGPGFSAEEAANLPAHLRTAAGVVTTAGEPTPAALRR
ncbi:MAG: DUF433 domain-containing protein [Chloroflexota bacterium]